MKYIFKLIFICSIFLVSCDSTNPQKYAKAQIDIILTDLEINFNADNLSELMKNYHPDYRQYKDGYYWGYEDVSENWDFRLAEYALLEIRDRDITLNGDFWATVTCKMVFIADNEEVITEEPSSENGDISYFYKTFDGEWKICGAQFSDVK